MGLITYNIEKYSPQQLVAIPLVLFIVSLVVIASAYMATGLPVTPGIDFSGGTAVTVITTDSDEQLQATFTGYPLSDISDMNNGKFLKFGSMDDAQYQSLSQLIGQK